MEPKIFGEHEDGTLEQLHDVASRAEYAALMADGHLGYIMPVGGVTAYADKVSVAGVGYDIGCGNAAARTNLTLEDFAGLGLEDFDRNPHRVRTNPRLVELADEVFDQLSFGIGRKNDVETGLDDHPIFRDDALWVIPNAGGYRDTLLQKARDQLGTIGGGNHYVDIFVDQEGYLWVGVHFGSRGFGHTIATNFLALTRGEPWGARVKEHEGLVHLQNPIGHDYFGLMGVAGRYAFLGRSWVVDHVLKIMGAEATDRVHNNHNFAWRENHLGRDLVVVRKGATPAFPGQRGFVGGSMGDDAVILRGAKHEEGSAERWVQKQALFSTVHGAGRTMGRRQAKRTLDEEAVRKWIRDRGVIVRGSDLDEAPQAYRRLPDVLEHQGDTVEVEHRLRPVVVCMAPSGTRDPYRD